VGQGTACPEYKDGLAKQTRTNVLLGVTAAVGVTTGVIGAFFTDWGGSPAAEKSGTGAPRILVGIGHGGPSITAAGQF
jgi:hypothetical protein